ncbi:MAG TPA: HAD hydrolase-like protein [Terriglobales bacterium]|jgi:phosphoglycolate phosphatase-like HAD superfamily hydrolase|nr:HAD hydrolase-like protein [Terriglobales bacterium]
MATVSVSMQELAELAPKHEFFVGIDSDGCAFDSMEIKHKECFCPQIIKYWDLQAVSKYAREVVEFINLYSKWRGTNRWPALILTLDLLRQRPEVIKREWSIPEAPRVRDFIASGKALSNDGLKAYMAEHPDPELEHALQWSKAVNAAVADIVHNLPPFPFVRESLEMIQKQADTVVVSATPTEALLKEWRENNIDKYVRVIAGQELGTKKQHLKMAAAGKYAANRLLMIGDAPGDLDAARSSNALFFPINPGHEEESWECFYKEGFKKFLAGEFAGAYENKLISEFDKLLPSIPPWSR